MVVRIGSNLLSQTVQRNLARSTADLSTASERLASGQRINKGSDDAAGLSIATSLRTDSRVFAQALRNLNDGLSFSNIAESAMDSLSFVVDRIQELSTQAMSGTFGDTQRQSMQKEVTALQAEWNRIVEGTTFNGRNLLTGADTRTVLQGGKGTDATLAVQIGEGQLAGGLDGYAGGTDRISVSSSGTEANGASFLFASGSNSVYALSGDGRYAVFDSAASNLVTGDTNLARDVFMRDLETGITTRVSTNAAGVQGNTYSWGGEISSDGAYVAFSSLANNLFNGDTNGWFDAVVKDLRTGVVSQVSTSTAGVAGNGNSYARAISADGRFVVFNSFATNLVASDTNSVFDAFVKDTVTGATTRVSTSTSGVEANYYSVGSAISADGRYVGFYTVAGNLVAGDTNGHADAFIKDLRTGVTTRVSTDSKGVEGLGGPSTIAAISADGRYVAFNSATSSLVAGDTNGARDGFIKDTWTGMTTRVTTSANGTQGNGDSYVRNMSADGRYVSFTSVATNLVEGDTNLSNDSFVKDLLTGEVIRINVASSGAEANALSTSTGAALSANGRIAIFSSTASNLVSGDTNGAEDVFVRDLTRTGVQQMSGMLVTNRTSAGVTLNLIQQYRNELTQYRSNIGASTSRISTFMNTIASANINYKAAESRITDADIAAESADTVRNTILQQTAATLLGQANLEPQIALRLLQNA